MKKIFTVLLFLLPVFANSQIINTVAGPSDFLACGGWCSSIAVDNAGNYYVSEESGFVYKVTPSGDIAKIAGNGTYGFSGDGGPATDASLYEPMGIAVDNAGNVYIADMGNERIRKINTSGVITTVAGSAGVMSGVGGFSGDGGPATAAQLSQPAGVYVNNAGDIFIADADNGRIRHVNALGYINTIAGGGTSTGSGILATSGRISEPVAVTFDNIGNMYICDGFGGNRIFKVTPYGVMYLIAGTGTAGYNGDGIAATSAQLNIPRGVAADMFGNVYIADNPNARIRKVDASGIITTYAGTGAPGFSGDGGPASMAQINTGNIAVDHSGNLVIADFGNKRIRAIANPLDVQTMPAAGKQINLFPIPAMDKLTITSDNTITNIAVLSLVGQTVSSTPFNASKVQIDISNLPAGIYMARINGSEIRKFVKQ